MEDEANDFGLKVLDRFSNPFIEHHWLNIILNYTSKMRSRDVPVLLEYFKKYNIVPKCMSLGFAAYLLFMKAIKKEDDKYYGESNGKFYFINDDQANYYFEVWNNNGAEHVVTEVLKNKNLWDEDLTLLKGFSKSVTDSLVDFMKNGVAKLFF